MKRINLALLTVVATSLLAACAPDDSSAPEGAVDTNIAALGTAITWRASSVSAFDQSTGPGMALSIAKPTGVVAGDVEVAVIASYSTITVAAPSGWTLVDRRTDTGTVGGGAGLGTSVFVRAVAAGEPASYAFTLSATARGIATIQAYANVDPVNPIDASVSSAETTSQTNHVTPSLATTRNGDVLVGVYGEVSPVQPSTTTSTIAHERLDRSCGNTGSWGINLAVYDTDARLGPATEASRVAVSSAPTDVATMALVALRPKATTLFGASFSPHDAATFDLLNGQFGAMGVTRAFDGGGGVTPFLNTVQALDVARNAASAYSFKYPPAEVSAGTHDTALKSFFNGIQDNHPVYWTFWHEPDDELYVNHTFTPTAYRAAWKHIRTIADSVKATRPNLDIHATLIIMQYSMTPKIAPSRPLLGTDGMYPGDDVIEVFGADTYNSNADQGDVADAATQFGKVIDFAQAHGKPWAVPELGSCPVKGNPQGRAQYLSQAITYWNSRSYPPAYAAYFDLNWPACDYRLDNDAPAKAVWHDAVTKGLAAFP